MVNIDQEEFERKREQARQFDINVEDNSRTQSLMHTEMQFNTNSFFKWGMVRIFSTHGRTLGILFMAFFFLVLALVAVKSIFGEASSDDIISGVWGVFVVIFTPIGYLLKWLLYLIFSLPETAYTIWSFVFATIFFTYIFGKNRDVFGFLYLKGDRTIKLILFPRFYDTAGRQYIGGRATFMQRLFHGNPRYPFHESFYSNAIHQTAKLDIAEVAPGRSLSRQWTGTILIIQTDPNDDIDDDEEVGKILLLHDELIVETGEYKRTVKITNKIYPFSDFQAQMLGEKLRYREGYHQLRDELHAAMRAIDDLQMDSATRLARDLVTSSSSRARRARGDDNVAEDGLDALDDEFEARTSALMDL